MTATEASTSTLERLNKFLAFSTFGDKQLERMVLACDEWLTAVFQKAAPRWITLLGNSGCGKTHCARKLWEYAEQKFDWSTCSHLHSPVYWPEFVQGLRAGDLFTKRTDMHAWPVVFLDDIGAERDASGFASDELNTLLGTRTGKWTIITANLNFKKLAAIDERIASRIVRDNNLVVQVNTEDYSLRKKSAMTVDVVPELKPVKISDEARAKGLTMLRDFVAQNQ